MTLLKHLPIIILATLLSSCGTTKKTTETYWVNSTKVDCDAGAGKSKCLQVTKANDFENANWSLFYAPIDGFKFESGYLQKIKVETTTQDSKKVPADASSKTYKLVEVLEKKQDPKMILNDIYTTTHINGEELKTNTEAPSLEINISKMRIFGSNGCNNYNGAIKTLNSTTIEFGPIATTRKMCRDMTIANQFNKALSATTTFKREGLILRFFDVNGNETARFNKVD